MTSLHARRRPCLIRGSTCVLTLVLLLLSVATTLFSQERSAEWRFIFFPHPVQEKAWQVSVGLTLTTPAREVTEEVAVRGPAFDAHALYGLPSNFTLDGRAISQVIQNHFSLGVRWAYPMGRFSVGAGYDVAWWFGFLEVGGFDSKANGWLNYPAVSVGYAFDDALLTLKAEAILNMSYSSFVGENEVSSDANTFAGMAFGLFLEQPFWKHTNVTLGFKANYTKFHWMTWALFSTFDQYLFYPEITIGFIL